MSNTDTSPLKIVGAHEWNAARLRFTSFPRKGDNLYSETWWSYATGDSPEKRTSEPRAKKYRDEGVIEDLGLLSLVSQRGRIDWNLIPNDTTGSGPPDDIPSIGKYTETLSLFKEYILRWLTHEDCPVSERIAFGAIVQNRVSSKEEGYSLLDKYLSSVVIDFENATDFLFQINRPRNSKSLDRPLLLNRLMKWTVAEIHYKSFRGIDLSIDQIDEEEFYACQIELDLNTDREYTGGLEPAHQTEIFHELLDLSIEIVEYGDIQ